MTGAPSPYHNINNNLFQIQFLQEAKGFKDSGMLAGSVSKVSSATREFETARKVLNRAHNKASYFKFNLKEKRINHKNLLYTTVLA